MELTTIRPRFLMIGAAALVLAAFVLVLVNGWSALPAFIMFDAH